MKAHMEEVEDDLAAEEENKLINEVGRILIFYCLSITAQQSVALFQEYKTWRDTSFSVFSGNPSNLLHPFQEEERAISLRSRGYPCP